MNREEARRFAHKLIANAIENGCAVVPGPDGEAIRGAIARAVEQHRRFGPKSTDRAPRLPEYRGEKLPLVSQS